MVRLSLAHMPLVCFFLRRHRHALVARINLSCLAIPRATIAVTNAVLAAYSQPRIALLVLRIEFKTRLVIAPMARLTRLVFLSVQVRLHSSKVSMHDYFHIT